jgi:succinate-semialdehyde dehydrogenase/glutarate-semialdehyde dehydrogenase
VCQINRRNICKAGYPKNVFQSLTDHDQIEQIIAHQTVKTTTLTGSSERAGSAVAEIAGKYIKKSVLELGGNNAFIVWEDADIEVVKNCSYCTNVKLWAKLYCC